PSMTSVTAASYASESRSPRTRASSSFHRGLSAVMPAPPQEEVSNRTARRVQVKAGVEMLLHCMNEVSRFHRDVRTPGGIHLWWPRPGDGESEGIPAWLPGPEQSQCRGISHPARRREAITARVLLRTVLSRHVPVPRHAWVFRHDALGKPTLGPSHPLRF